MKIKVAIVACLAMLVFGAVDAFAATKTVNNTVACSAGGPVYCTIQQGVTAAAAGDTVSVAAGAYTGDVTISSLKTGLTLNGAQAGSPIALRTFGSATETTLTGGTTASSGAIIVQVSGVTVDGFSLTKSQPLNQVFGI